MKLNESKDGLRILPATCPSCARALNVSRLACPACGTAVEGEFALSLLARLEPEEQQFVIHFIRSSGSLKQLAVTYRVSYPTVRNRLDALIDKLNTLTAGVAPGKKEGNDHGGSDRTDA